MRAPHIEKHFTAGLFVRDVVIGMADGLTVPFALAAGLSGAVQDTKLIVVGGLAEIAAGSIAMGLGGYLAARGDAEHYEQERIREQREVKEMPEEENPQNQERGFSSSLENAKSAFPTFPPLGLLLSINPEKNKIRISLARSLRLPRRWREERW